MNPSLYKIEVYFPDGVREDTSTERNRSFPIIIIYQSPYLYERLFIAIGLRSFMKGEIRYG